MWFTYTPLSSTTLVCCLELSTGKPIISTSTKGSIIWQQKNTWESIKRWKIFFKGSLWGLDLVSSKYCCLTSPLSPNMESLGLGSCCPLMIFSTSWVFLCPGRGSSSMGLKAPEDNQQYLLPSHTGIFTLYFILCSFCTYAYLYACTLASEYIHSFHCLRTWLGTVQA